MKKLLWLRRMRRARYCSSHRIGVVRHSPCVTSVGESLLGKYGTSLYPVGQVEPPCLNSAGALRILQSFVQRRRGKGVMWLKAAIYMSSRGEIHRAIEGACIIVFVAETKVPSNRMP